MSAANPKASRFRIQVLNRQRRFEISAKSIASLCTDVFEVLGVRSAAVEVVFVGVCKMRQVNRQYRKKDYPTDVLSFGYQGERADGRPFLGAIVIAPQVAEEQAARYRVAFEAEIRRLVIHGMLHLLGYDHEADHGDMIRLQNRLLHRRRLAPGFPIIKAGSRQ